MHKTDPVAPSANRAGTERRALIVAARKRGLSMSRIAVAIGVSRQNVQQHLWREAAATGDKSLLDQRRRKYGVKRVLGTCAQCGRGLATKPWAWRKNPQGRRFCSSACCVTAQTTVLDDTLERVIEMRRSGVSWKQAAKMTGVSYQSVQKRIWQYLHKRGLLTPDAVSAIWMTGEQRRPPAWQHLIRKTGCKIQRAPTARANGNLAPTE